MSALWAQQSLPRGGLEVSLTNMPKAKVTPQSEAEKTILLLEKLLVVQLYALDVPQTSIAKIVGRGTLWVNDLLKNIPKK